MRSNKDGVRIKCQSKPLWHLILTPLLLLLILHGVASAADEVRHTVSFPIDRQQVIHVRSEFPVSGAITDLIMPNWTPGSYLIREFAANIGKMSVKSANGPALPMQKISKDRWRVSSDQATTLVVDYEVFTPDLSVSNSWASEDFILLNGASVFLYTEHSRQLAQLVKIDTGNDRGDVFTAMPKASMDEVLKAENYDALVDNPIAVANAPSYGFRHKKQQYKLVNVGENEFWDGQQAARDVEKIVAETQSFWKINPLNKTYWFLNFAVEAKGGLEHDHSTVIMTGRRQMVDRDDYIQWMVVVAHEFFHVWNVRHMRPAGLESIDYQHEQYTDQLWLAEGLTSYYDSLLCSRAGLIKPEEYMELLAKDVYKLETVPGRFLRPITDVSVDAWIRHYQPNANSVNSTISYYTKGAVIGFVLDTYIRKESKNRHNLDEVMRKMYSLYSDKSYDSDAFKRIVIEVGGQGAGVLLQKLLTTTDDPDVDSALDWYGLELQRGVEAATKNQDETQTLESGFGVIWDIDKPGLVIKAVLAGSGGSKAGLMPQDEILAIADERLTLDTLNSLVSSFAPGQETTLLLSRRGRLLRVNIKLDQAIPERFTIVLKSDFGGRHIKRLQSLLGQNLNAPP